MIGYFCGEYLDLSAIRLGIHDLGFTMGVTVTERFRTYRGIARFVDSNLRRFRDGLEIVGIPLPSDLELSDVIAEVVAYNRVAIDVSDDLEISLFATPGDHGRHWMETVEQSPLTLPSLTTLGVLAMPARFGLWAHKYSRGERLSVAMTRETSASNWPRRLKCRSRMHYWLADREADQIESGSKALLLDQHGFVAETSTGLVAAVIQDTVIAPPEIDVLQSTSFAVAEQLLASMGVSIERKKLLPEQLLTAEEAMVFSAPYFALPITAIDGRDIGAGLPGKLFNTLIDRFSAEVGIDVVEQANSFAHRCC